jgi:hypothetical protein
VQPQRQLQALDDDRRFARPRQANVNGVAGALAEQQPPRHHAGEIAVVRQIGPLDAGQRPAGLRYLRDYRWQCDTRRPVPALGHVSQR